MPRQVEGVIQSAGNNRVLALGPVLIHNDHLLSGVREVRHCRVCVEGLGGVMEDIKKGVPLDSAPKVPEGDGADKKGDAPSPPGDWNNPKGKSD